MGPARRLPKSGIQQRAISFTIVWNCGGGEVGTKVGHANPTGWNCGGGVGTKVGHGIALAGQRRKEDRSATNPMIEKMDDNLGWLEPSDNAKLPFEDTRRS